MKITVVGTGYVGLSQAILLAKDNNVVALDLNKTKIDLINKRISPIKDEEISNYLENHNLKLFGTLNSYDAYKDANFIVICTPTDYNEESNNFDTTSIESCLDEIMNINPLATVIIKSTVPIGYTEGLKTKLNKENIIFVPEFLREGKALYDNLYPSRIIIGDNSSYAEEFAKLLAQGAVKKNIPILFVKNTEAEAIKLFSNTYLAMRVSYFNELDSFAETKGLDTKNIIEGMSYDERIGNLYNNPSFGYGGYCLPKDTKQLLSNYKGIPNKIIKAIVESNVTRKEYIASRILMYNPKKIGIYRLIMKANSDNFRYSAIHDIVKMLKSSGIEIIIYEPGLTNDYVENKLMNDFENFINECDIVIANRIDEKLKPYKDKVYTRDLFYRD